MGITVAALRIYPVKSCGGIRLPSSEIDARGLQYDRAWMIVDPDGVGLTQRNRGLAKMAVIRPIISAELHMLVLALGGTGERVFVYLEPDASRRRTVIVWGVPCEAIDEGDSAADALSRFLGTPCRLVRMADENRRPARRGAATIGFSDGYPFLVLSTASLDELSSRLTTPVPVESFRPTIVLAGCDPHAEDTWTSMTIGDVRYLRMRPCARCVITTIDQQTGTPQGAEPLRTLGTYRRFEFDGKPEIHFGSYYNHASPGEISVGDAVAVE